MKYGHRGSAKATTLASPCGPTDLSFLLADPAGWPDGTRGPFFVALSKGNLIEEKVLCASRTASTVYVWTDGLDNGRGMDDTTAQDHPVNAPVEHVWTATEAEEASAHINATEGVHGLPASSDLMTLSGNQEATGVKTFPAPVLNDPVITGGTAANMDSITADVISVVGAQTEQAFIGRNIYIGDRDPLDSEGNNGDLWIRKG